MLFLKKLAKKAKTKSFDSLPESLIIIFLLNGVKTELVYHHLVLCLRANTKVTIWRRGLIFVTRDTLVKPATKDDNLESLSVLVRLFEVPGYVVG